LFLSAATGEGGKDAFFAFAGKKRGEKEKRLFCSSLKSWEKRVEVFPGRHKEKRGEKKRKKIKKRGGKKERDREEKKGGGIFFDSAQGGQGIKQASLSSFHQRKEGKKKKKSLFLINLARKGGRRGEEMNKNIRALERKKREEKGGEVTCGRSPYRMATVPQSRQWGEGKEECRLFLDYLGRKKGGGVSPTFGL